MFLLCLCIFLSLVLKYVKTFLKRGVCLAMDCLTTVDVMWVFISEINLLRGLNV